jgi:predicted AAA+ superfamily ATPase
MAGRARQIHFLPFNYNEVRSHHFDLKKFLLYGGLPDAYLSKNPWEELKDYAGTYLTEEIQSSAFVRKIENWRHPLQICAPLYPIYNPSNERHTHSLDDSRNSHVHNSLLAPSA